MIPRRRYDEPLVSQKDISTLENESPATMPKAGLFCAKPEGVPLVSAKGRQISWMKLRWMTGVDVA